MNGITEKQTSDLKGRDILDLILDNGCQCRMEKEKKERQIHDYNMCKKNQLWYDMISFATVFCVSIFRLIVSMMLEIKYRFAGASHY